MSKRYQVKPCDNGGTVTNAVRDRQWDVIDTTTGQTVANYDKRTDARTEAAKLNTAPSVSIDPIIAANHRVGSAIAHLELARAQIDNALADLSSVIGAGDCYRKLLKVAEALKPIRHKISEDHHRAWEKRDHWKLDHEPKNEHAAHHGHGSLEGHS